LEALNEAAAAFVNHNYFSNGFYPNYLPAIPYFGTVQPVRRGSVLLSALCSISAAYTLIESGLTAMCVYFGDQVELAGNNGYRHLDPPKQSVPSVISVVSREEAIDGRTKV
jgi:hypothetical protein